MIMILVHDSNVKNCVFGGIGGLILNTTFSYTVLNPQILEI